MELPSGVYIIENVRNRNWAILSNDNDGDDVKSGTDADTDTGHKWEIRMLHNGTYLIRNQQFRNLAGYNLTDVSDHPSVLSIRTGASSRWRINSTGRFHWVSDLEGARCWTLKYDQHETPITLERYTYSDHQHWKIVPESEVHNPQRRVSELGALPAKPRQGIRRCPPPTPVFTGRREILRKMHNYFASDVGKRHIFVLHGLGGVGKSEITLKFIEESQVDAKPSRFSEVFFIDASSAETATADLRNIALAKRTGDSAEDALLWLSELIEEWLLFFDNADDPTLNLHNFFPRAAHGNIIVTSRNCETRIHAPDPRSESKVSRLLSDDAVDLLLKMARVNPEQSGHTRMLAANIVEELGRLALAVVQAGAYISKSRCGLAPYLEMYRNRRIGFLDEYQNQVQKIDDYEWTVYTTWTVSFEKLSTRAAMLLNICAFFHHDGISVELFQRAANNIETRILGSSNGLQLAKTFLSSFRSTEGHRDLHEFLSIMAEISSYSLIDFDERNETYSIHPLVHAWTRTRVANPTTIHECSQILLSMSIDGAYGSKDIAFRRTLLPHVDASLRFGTPEPGVAEWLCHPYHEGGRWKEAEKLQVLVMETRRRALGEEHPTTLASMAHLGSTYWSQGRWKEAEELEVRVMGVKKRVFGKYHPSTLVSMANLALTYWGQGRWKEAEALEVWVIKAQVQALGEEHPDTLRSMAYLASTYSSQGRWKEAEELGVSVMEMKKRVLGVEHPSTLVSMASVASTYWSQGRWREAEELEVQVMELRKRVFGENHPDTLTSVADLVSTYSSQGRWEEAEELGRRVIEMQVQVLGEEHPFTLRSMAHLASTYSSQGRWKEAEVLGVSVMEMKRRVLGEEHPSTLVSMAIVASTYSSQGRWKEAEELGVWVMGVKKRVLGEDHPSTLVSIASLALTYWGQGRWREAEELLVQVVWMSKRVLGDEHPDTLMRVAWLASLVGDRVYRVE